MSTLQEEIQKYVDYAAENMGNDVLLSQITDDLLVLFKQQMLDLLGKDEDVLPIQYKYIEGKIKNPNEYVKQGANNLRAQLRKEVEKL